jgi:hypothetical protein
LKRGEKEVTDKSDNENSFTGKLFGKFGRLLINPFVTVRLIKDISLQIVVET